MRFHELLSGLIHKNAILLSMGCVALTSLFATFTPRCSVFTNSKKGYECSGSLIDLEAGTCSNLVGGTTNTARRMEKKCVPVLLRVEYLNIPYSTMHLIRCLSSAVAHVVCSRISIGRRSVLTQFLPFRPLFDVTHYTHPVC